MEQASDTTSGKWNPPECPWQIEYSARVADDIRLAVMDAFFSLPRGGAEIGGILLGKREGNRLSILEHEPLDCEHATGPSFTLSARDQTLLEGMLAKARRNTANRQPLGWYHSHTRSEIFLSETDQEIHQRFFPEPWQVALVLKPHTFEPTRAGFFFREADGTMRGSASYQEFVLDALPLRPVPVKERNGSPAYRPLHPSRGPMVPTPGEPLVAAEPPPAMDPPPRARDKGVPITREVAVEPPRNGAGGESPVETRELLAPGFTQLKRERRSRHVKAAACLAVGLAVGGLGYETRELWLPRFVSDARAVLPKEPDAFLSLSVTDKNGQLIIRWDRNAPAVRHALHANLEITDGSNVPRFINLDGPHLAEGAFNYGRETDRVDVAMITSEPGGQQVKEQTSFLGKLPGQRRQVEDPEVRKERDAQAQRADQLQKDLNSQAAKTRKLEKDLKEVRDQLSNEQRRRLAAQTPDPEKKN